MLRSIWTQRSILLLCAIALGLIVDRYAQYPWWGVAAGAIAVIVGFASLGRSILLEPVLKLDSDSAAIVRVVVLALLFLVECAILGWLIALGSPAAG